MSTAWKQALALGLAASLVASPALAGGRHKGRGHRGHRGDYDYAPARYDRHHHHHHGGDADELALALGLTAVGVTAFALWAAAQPPAPPVYGTPLEAASPEPSDWSELEPGVTVLSEGYLDSGEFCREFQREIEIDGRIERGWGIACLMEDGSWRIGR